MLERPFAAEAAPQPGDAGSGDDAGYSFEGFNVDFSEKIMLTPVSLDGPGDAKRRVMS